MAEAEYKEKNRVIFPGTKHTPLSEAMHQGGGYQNGMPPHGLDNQMYQGSGGYEHKMASKPTFPKLRELMGQ